MAVTPQDTDEAFLREVDEGVRRDQVLSLWQRYGKLGIALLLLFLGAVAGGLWWRENETRKAGIAGEDFTQAISKLEVGDAAAARPVLDRLAKDGPGGYRAIARMMQAADAVGLLLKTAQAQGATLVIATHDARVAALIPPEVNGQIGFQRMYLLRKQL